MTSIEADSSGDKTVLNEFGQAVGLSMKNWIPPPIPPRKALEGKYCHLEPLKAKPHAEDIWNAQSDDRNGVRWTYMPFGPFANLHEFEQWGMEAEHSHDTQFSAVIVDNHVIGFVAYTHIRPSHGVVEVDVYYSSQLAKTRAATEAMYLAIANVFDLGYRRIEWTCDSCNLPSQNAASRFGFTYEGLFRQALVHKGRNRDSSWYSIINRDWNSGLKDAYEQWMNPSSFGSDGQQKMKLSELTAPFVRAKP